MSSIDVARESIEAFNTNDWERFGSMLSDDSIYDEPGTQRHVQGVEEILDVNRG
jgi:hypothetical protein